MLKLPLFRGVNRGCRLVHLDIRCLSVLVAALLQKFVLEYRLDHRGPWLSRLVLLAQLQQHLQHHVWLRQMFRFSESAVKVFEPQKFLLLASLLIRGLLLD
jgi:hypothetical protein